MSKTSPVLSATSPAPYVGARRVVRNACAAGWRPHPVTMSAAARNVVRSGEPLAAGRGTGAVPARHTGGVRAAGAGRERPDGGTGSGGGAWRGGGDEAAVTRSSRQGPRRR